MIIKPKPVNPGDRSFIESEKNLDNVAFNVLKYNNRPVPTDPKDKIIITSFSEFGCEIVSAMYCIPEIIRKNPGKYFIVVGWYGREYLYKHLVDEFWELKEEHQWLREYARAFHHESKNLKKIEKKLANYGKICDASVLGVIAIGNKCNKCGSVWGDISGVKECKKCLSNDIEGSIFGNVHNWKSKAVKIPKPSLAKMEEAKKYIRPNSVGVFARGRKCYGRNLQPEFYKKLIHLLQSMQYNVVWLGEKTSTQPCPIDDVVDFSRMPESRDLELTLAIISQLQFTVQFWTASTRLASMMGIPYILFESPDQIWGIGQEGIRRSLCDFGPSKLVVSHFKNVYENNDVAIEHVRRAILEMQVNNYEDIFGLLENPMLVRLMKEQRLNKIYQDATNGFKTIS